MESTTTPKIAAVYCDLSQSQPFTTLSSEEASLNGKYTRPLAVPPTIPFSFATQRIRIDWRMLHGVNICKLISNTDVAMLDELVPAIAYGDLEAEDPMTLTETNFIKIFRLSQLIIEYLLYVQDTLSTQCSCYREERGQIGRHLSACRIRLREQSASLKLYRRELKQARRALRTYELLASPEVGHQRKTLINPSIPPQHPCASDRDTNPTQKLATDVKHTLDTSCIGQDSTGDASPDNQLTRTLKECNTLKAERRELQDQVRQINDSLEKLKECSYRWQGESGSLPPTERATDRSLVFNLEVNQQLKDKLRQANEQLRSLGEGKSEAQLKVVELMRKLSSLEKENLVLRERALLLDGTGQVQVLQREKDLLTTQLDDLERKLSKSEKLSRELQGEIELRIKSEGSENKPNPAAQTRNEQQSNATIQRLRDRNQHLETELDSADKFNRVAKEEIKQLEKENEDLRMEVEMLKKQSRRASLVPHVSFPKEEITSDNEISGEEGSPSQEIQQILSGDLLPPRFRSTEIEIKDKYEGEAGDSTTPSVSSWCSPPVPEPSKSVEDPPLQRLVRVESVYNGTAPFSQRSTEFQSNANSLSKAQVHVLVARGRVVTEEQARISEADLKTFEEKYPFQFPGNMAVLSTEPHTCEEHASAFPTISSNLEDMVWREYHKMGINPAWKCLSDAEYAVATRHLELKREQIVQSLPRDKQARYGSLHKSLAFHLHRSLPSPQAPPALQAQRRYSSGELSFQQGKLNVPIQGDPCSNSQWGAVGPLARGLVKQRSLLNPGALPQHDPKLERAQSLPIQPYQPEVPGDTDAHPDEEVGEESQPSSPASSVHSETALTQSSRGTVTSIGTRIPHAPQSASHGAPGLDTSVPSTSPAVKPSLRIYGDGDEFDGDDSNSETATRSWTSTQATESQYTAHPESVQRSPTSPVSTDVSETASDFQTVADTIDSNSSLHGR